MSFYIIKSKLTGYALDVEGGGGRIGARVIPWDRHGGDNQLWYDDPTTGAIRSKAGNLCLDIENDQLCVREYQPGDPNQQWFRDTQHIRNRFDRNRVLDIMNNCRDKGAKISSWAFNGGPNQSWDFEYVGGQAPIGGGYPGAGGYPSAPAYGQPAYPGYPPQGGYPVGGYPPQQGYPSQPGYPPAQGYPGFQRRDFFIVSEMNQKVVDIDGGNASPGARVIMWPRSNPPSKNQSWYLDQQGFIRSALNDMVFSNQGNCQGLRMQPAGMDPRSQWTVEGRKISNRYGEALDISRGCHDNGAELISYQYKDSSNQRWRIEYI